MTQYQRVLEQRVDGVRSHMVIEIPVDQPPEFDDPDVAIELHHGRFRLLLLPTTGDDGSFLEVEVYAFVDEEPSFNEPGKRFSLS